MDSEIWGLTAETEVESTCRIPLQTNTGVDALYATAALLGGLQVSNQTVTTSDITGAVGKLYVCTIAGLTAVRNLTLPSAQVGERVGVYIVDGDASFELVIKGAASQTINGGSAATEWSRLFIQGECCVFRCVAANTWIVEYDGRIPCFVKAYDDTGLSVTSTAATPSFAAASDNGNLLDTTNDYIKIRRAGNYNFYTMSLSGASIDAGKFLATKLVYDPTSTAVVYAQSYMHSAATNQRVHSFVEWSGPLAVADTMDMEISASDSAGAYTSDSGANNSTTIHLYCEELL